MPLVWLIVGIFAITALVGVVAQFLNKMNAQNAPAGRRPVPAPRAAAPIRQPEKDMDRFLAEIDRLRNKPADRGRKAEPVQETSSRRGSDSPRPAQPARTRPRIVAEVVEKAKPKARREVTPMAAPPAPVAPGTLSPNLGFEDLPVATVVTPTSATGAPATRITRLASRSRPEPKTELAKNLTKLLGSPQGVAMSIILQEVLGPPRSRQKTNPSRANI